MTISDSGGVPIVTSQLDYPVRGKPPKSVSLITLTDAQFAALGGKDEWRIRGQEGKTLRLAMRQLDGVRAELGKCVADLRAYWNMDSDTPARIKSPPRPLQPLSRYFSAFDYPTQALSEQNTGIVGVRLMIDEAGKVADCSTTATSGSAVLDAVSCIVLRERARYSPAVSLDGKPMRGFDDTRITWRMR